MFILAYVVTFLGQLHFTRNYFFTVNTSAQLLLLQSNQFDTTITFSEQLLFWSSYFLNRLTSSHQLLFQNSYLFGAKVLPRTSINSSSFRAAGFSEQLLQEDKFVQNIDIHRIISFSKQALLQNIKFFRRCIQNPFKYVRWSVFAQSVKDFKPLTV